MSHVCNQALLIDLEEIDVRASVLNLMLCTGFNVRGVLGVFLFLGSSSQMCVH